MSFKVTSEVWELDGVPSQQRIVLLAMAEHAHDDGEHAYPSRARLAARCGCDERTVQRAIQWLIGKGLLQLCQAATQHKPNSYRVCPRGDSLPGGRHAVSPAESPPGEAESPPGEAESPPGEAESPSRGGTAPPESSGTFMNPTHTVNAEPLTERVAAKRKAKATAEEGASTASFAAFWAEWPKRVEKQAASVLWKKIQLDEVPAVMLGLRRWKESGQWDEVRFCPNPDKWLRRRKWEDEIKPAAASGGFVG